MVFQKKFLIGNKGMAAYGIVILITMIFLFFSVGTGIVNWLCTIITQWDNSRVEELKGTSQLDVIRYSLILHRVRTGEYPEKLDLKELKNMVNRAYGHGNIIDAYFLIKYERSVSYDGPTYKLILKHKKNDQTFHITSYKVSL
jgi:hypothetical protein